MTSTSAFQPSVTDSSNEAVNQPLLFHKLRMRLLHNSVQALLHGSSLRLFTIVACSALIWVAVFAASAQGFGLFRKHDIPLAGGVVATLFDLLFLALTGLLIVSTG